MYTLTLTSEDWQAISFSGGRYQWSDTLSQICVEGENDLSESETWQLGDAFQSDTEGGHSPFPLLAPGSLMVKLNTLWNSIV